METIRNIYPILHEDKEHLHEVKDDIEAFLFEHLRLNLNNKTAIRPVSHGVEFVGYRIYTTKRKLKKKTAKKMRRSLKGVRAQHKRGEITKERLRQIEASYDGMLQHITGSGLREKLGLIKKPETAKEVGTFIEPAQRKCYNCVNYREGLFCGYVSSYCEVYGSLDVDQNERHPDTEATRCKRFCGRKAATTMEGGEK